MTLIKISKHTHRKDMKKDYIYISKDSRLHIGIDAIGDLKTEPYAHLYVDAEQKLICIEFKSKNPSDKSLYSVIKGVSNYSLRISKALDFYGLDTPLKTTELKHYIEKEGPLKRIFVSLDNLKKRSAVKRGKS